MLSPKRTKFRKAQKGRIHGMAKGGTALNFGTFGLKALEPERVTARQIEAARRAVSRAMKRQGRMWIRIFPDLPVSKRPPEVCLRLTAYLRKWQERRLPSLLPNSPSRRNLFRQLKRYKMVKKIEELRAKTDSELQDSVIALKKEALNLRFQQANGQLKNTARMRQVKREVAKIKTVLSEKKAAEAKETK